LCSNQDGTLIVLYPKESFAIYLDAGSDEKKDYRHISSVLDDALNGYCFLNEGILRRTNNKRGKMAFTHKVDLTCIKKAHGSPTDAWYVIYLMQQFIRSHRRLEFPVAMDKWCKELAKTTDADITQEFALIQKSFAAIIVRDVCRDTPPGLFYYQGATPSNVDLQNRIAQQCDYRPFNSLNGSEPFPPKPMSKPTKMIKN
jgi:hypothetical protein